MKYGVALTGPEWIALAIFLLASIVYFIADKGE
jgi:hypothetical protein